MNLTGDQYFLNEKNSILSISKSDLISLKLESSNIEKAQLFSSDVELCADLAINDVFKSKEEMELTPIIFSPNSDKAQRYFDILGVEHTDRYVCYILTHFGLLGFTSVYHLKKLIGKFELNNFNDFKKYRGNFALPPKPMQIPA